MAYFAFSMRKLYTLLSVGGSTYRRNEIIFWGVITIKYGMFASAITYAALCKGQLIYPLLKRLRRKKKIPSLECQHQAYILWNDIRSLVLIPTNCR